MLLARTALAAFIALLLLLAGCAPTTGRVERALERELPSAIGPADRYEVSIDGLRARTGQAERVTLLGEGVRPEGAPVLERLDAELYGVRYDRRAERLDRVESTRATARITADALAAYLQAHRNVAQAAVELHAPDEATLRVRPALSGFRLPAGAMAEVRGRLVAVEGQVVFEVAEVRAGGFRLGAAMTDLLSAEINPLVDLSELTDHAAGFRVTEVRVEDGAVVLDATGDLTGLSFR